MKRIVTGHAFHLINAFYSVGTFRGTPYIVLFLVPIVILRRIFIGYTLQDIQNCQAVMLPWAATASIIRAPLHIDQCDSFYPFLNMIDKGFAAPPLWVHESFGGWEFLANMQNFYFYPPVHIATALFETHTAFDALIFTHMILSGWTMFLLLRALRCSIPASMIGALSWQLNSYFLAWAPLLHIVTLQALLPLIVMFLLPTVAGVTPERFTAIAVTYAAIIVGSHPGMILSATWFIVGFIAAATLFVGDRRMNQALVLFCALGTGCLIAAVCLLPFLDLMRSSGRVPPSISDYKAFGAPLASFLESVVFFRKTPVDVNNGQNLFLSIPLVALASLGVVRAFSLGRAVPVALFAVGMLFAAAVTGGPVAELFFHIPGLSNVKPIGRLFFVVTFCASVASGFGFDQATAIIVRWLEHYPRFRRT